MADVASQWTLAHEAAHVLGLPHIDTPNPDTPNPDTLVPARVPLEDAHSGARKWPRGRWSGRGRSAGGTA